jgi:S1-C subfamily serine protease
MNNRGVMAGLGCGVALLLLLLIPIGLLWFAFSGGLNFNLPDLGNPVPETGQVPRQPVPRNTMPVTRPEQTDPIPQTGNQIARDPGNVAEPVTQPPDNLADLYDQVSPGTVSILVGTNTGGQFSGGTGSGFVVTDNGFIITNDHVVEGGSRYIVRFFNELDMTAELIGVDPDSDLAVLKVEQLPEGAYPLPLGDSSNLRVGDSVVAIGNPFGLGTSMSYGIVSALGRTIPSITPQFNIPQAIQTDAAINPGNSGGPLINMNGEVIGVNAQIRTAGDGGGNVGIGFAIPVNIVKNVYPALIEDGVYRWAYLGVSSPAEMPGILPEGEQQQATMGAYIADVVPGGPADQAGMRPGDVVVSADGQEVSNFDDLLGLIAFRRPGDVMNLTALRDGQQVEISVTLGERPAGGIQ